MPSREAPAARTPSRDVPESSEAGLAGAQQDGAALSSSRMLIGFTSVVFSHAQITNRGVAGWQVAYATGKTVYLRSNIILMYLENLFNI